MNPDDITITVPADSLEAAIHGTRKGEQWETKTGMVLQIEHGMAVAYAHALYSHPRLDYWHRVEEPLLCPACGEEMRVAHSENWWVSCDNCGVRGPWSPTESAAREAWQKMLVDAR